jgi:hypothetical protein
MAGTALVERAVLSKSPKTPRLHAHRAGGIAAERASLRLALLRLRQQKL